MEHASAWRLGLERQTRSFTWQQVATSHRRIFERLQGPVT